MRLSLPLLFLAACSSAPPGQDFSTVRCRADQIAAARPHPGGTPGFTEYTAPASGVTYLVDAKGVETTGTAPDDPGTVKRFSAEELAGWEREVDRSDKVVRWKSPEQQPRLRDADKMVLTVIPGTAKTIEVVVSPKSEVDKRERRHRVLTFAMDGSAPDQPKTLTADIADVLHGSWGDEKKVDSPIRNIEVAVPRGQDEGFQILDMAFLGEEGRYLGAAGTQVAEVSGRLMPSWFVRAGAKVRIPVTVEPGMELRWHDAGIGGSRTRVVTVTPAEGEPVELDRSEGRNKKWTHHTASLADFEGQQVWITLTTEEDEGLALFGDPRLVVPREDNAPNVLLYLVDTLRADHVGAYGSQAPNVTPTLDRMAAEGTQFNAAFSHSPWTKPSIPTLMSGQLPTTHQVGSNDYTDKMPESVPLIATRMREAGYRTGSFSASPLGSDLSGLERDFSLALPPRAWWGKLGPLGHTAIDQLQEEALEFWLEEPDQPVFLYMHAMEVHAWRRSPYASPPPGLESYDMTVQDVDTKIGQFLAELEKRQLTEDLVVAVTSDHGESLTDGDVKEHGVKDHGTSLYNSQIQIPFIVWGDGIPAQGVRHPVGLSDMAPTLLDLAKAEPLGDIDGVSLVPYLAGPVTEPLHEDGVMSARLRYIWQPTDDKWFSLVEPDFHKLVRKETKFEYYFDLEEDLCEGKLTSDDPAAAKAELDRQLAAEEKSHQAWSDEHGSVLSGAVDAGDVQMLQEMGYVEK